MSCAWPDCDIAVEPISLFERLSAKFGAALGMEASYFCARHRVGAVNLMRSTKRDLRATDIYGWPRCQWCGHHVDGEHFRRLHEEGHQAGDAVYCAAHRLVEGRDPRLIARQGLTGGQQLLNIPEERLVRFPQRDLNAMVGPMVPKRVYYVAAFPGGGKTSAVTNWIWHWVRVRKLRVRYLALESSIEETFARFACFMAGVNPDDALSYRLRDAANRGDEDARTKLSELEIAYSLLLRDDEFHRLLQVDPVETLTPREFHTAIEATRALGADILIADHVDHAEADADDFSPDIKVSNHVQHMALRAAKSLGIPILLTTQLNSSRSGNDPVTRLRAPSADWLFNKSKKEMIGAAIIGIHRVVDPKADPKLIKRVRNRDAEPWKVALPHVMGISDMKMRFGRGTTRSTILLDFTHGVISDMPRDPFEAFDQEIARARAPQVPRSRSDVDWMNN